MPVFRGSVIKSMDGAPKTMWQNRYWVSGADSAAAMLNLQSAMNAEIAFHATTVVFRRLYLHAAAVYGGSKDFIPMGVNGEYSPAAGNALPDWLTVRVDCHIPDYPRKGERKYYRPGLTLPLLDGQTWDEGYISLVQSVFNTLVTAGDVLYSPDGTAIHDAMVQGEVQMRQDNWRRKHKPGFKRGWVPV